MHRKFTSRLCGVQIYNKEDKCILSTGSYIEESIWRNSPDYVIRTIYIAPNESVIGIKSG